MFNYQAMLPTNNELRKALLEVSREYYNLELSVKRKELDNSKKQSKIFSRFNRGKTC